ncbi:type II toxin-antitoxin system RatA family toxin [Hyphococcus flavus]|uniref:Type II toxin-antitoxin system RatA family toxin n=1 Tax=Hyphococcus flavus TaxID=1866326 RepID=A0AAE9ZI90_9PROT|nr:type II toxin-antitoxin system RatA family toxin [Hyphococcus flavus]WDI30780.1 type II toxin-antitoxin system RatA family toxin [Hyphococcus flavus]
MTVRKTTTEVPYTARQMFDLVADVKRYPEFLPWCTALRVVKSDLREGEGTLTADMVVAYAVFRERFRTEVALNREVGEIDVHYLDGPFRNLENQWRFKDKPAGGSIIDFAIDFEFKNVLLQATAQAVFDKAFARMTEAFVKRAEEVYG